MMEKVKKRLGEILIEDGILTREDLQEALENQKKDGGMIGQILVRLGFISEENLIAALGKQLNMPYMPLMNYAINTQTVQLLNEKFSRNHMVIAFDQDEQRVFLAMADPFDSNAVSEVEKQLNLKPHVYLSTPTEIINMLDMAYSMSGPNKELKKAG